MKNKDSSVTFELDGKSVTLEPTLEAVQVMSRVYGGLVEIRDKVKNLDLDAICVTIRAGLLVDGDEAEKIAPAVYKTGIMRVAPHALEYIFLCMVGGVLPDDDEGDGEEPSPGKPEA